LRLKMSRTSIASTSSHHRRAGLVRRAGAAGAAETDAGTATVVGGDAADVEVLVEVMAAASMAAAEDGVRTFSTGC